MKVSRRVGKSISIVHSAQRGQQNGFPKDVTPWLIKLGPAPCSGVGRPPDQRFDPTDTTLAVVMEPHHTAESTNNATISIRRSHLPLTAHSARAFGRRRYTFLILHPFTRSISAG
ncbi:Hypothetical protein NTJ_00908 [Nesidiocoris tenuis]|uniref:Uncharacterized protein n=1 Tax=Nesidiocoris tenuis TaxID=355587 RepID=A0ABN7ACX3_9HEMI|nr:Hypothetical protein NTJ_00908 [Nesidiocoris tenuis]